MPASSDVLPGSPSESFSAPPFACIEPGHGRSMGKEIALYGSVLYCLQTCFTQAVLLRDIYDYFGVWLVRSEETRRPLKVFSHASRMVITMCGDPPKAVDRDQTPPRHTSVQRIPLCHAHVSVRTYIHTLTCTMYRLGICRLFHTSYSLVYTQSAIWQGDWVSESFAKELGKGN